MSDCLSANKRKFVLLIAMMMLLIVCWDDLEEEAEAERQRIEYDQLILSYDLEHADDLEHNVSNRKRKKKSNTNSMKRTKLDDLRKSDPEREIPAFPVEASPHQNSTNT